VVQDDQLCGACLQYINQAKLARSCRYLHQQYPQQSSLDVHRTTIAVDRSKRADNSRAWTIMPTRYIQ
jgi:hypothetical protein